MNLTQNIKSYKNQVRSILFSCIMGSTVVTNSNAQNGEAIFKQTCTACHTIGGGKLVGPDLKGVTEKRKEAWLLKFIKGSQAFVKTDADAKAIFEQFKIAMPDQNLSDADIKAILSYIKETGGATAAPEASASSSTQETTTSAEATVKKSDDATDTEVALGMKLFEGSVSFKNGGASCLSCHNVNYDGLLKGGVLAKDLTNVYSRLGGDAGLTGILGAPPFPAMTEAFKDKPLTNEEIFAITAFLNKADKSQVYQHPNNTNPLVIGGAIGLCIIFGAIFILWNDRKKGMTKENIYNRQTKSI